MRLEQVVEEYGDDVELIWRSFMLRPEPEERSAEKFAEYTRSWERPASMEPTVTFRTWSTDNAPPSHSMPSAVAGKVAARFGPERYRAFHRRAMEAYFTENRTISDRSVLLDLAEEAGIDREAFDQRWQEEGEALLAEVVAEHNEAVGAGINAVPSLVVGEKYLVAGAVDVADYRRVIDTYRSETATEPGPDAGS